VQADGVLLVVRSGELPRKRSSHRDLLSSVKCRILGAFSMLWTPSAPDYTILSVLIRTPMDMVPQERLSFT